jgi:hypothetical protein
LTNRFEADRVTLQLLRFEWEYLLWMLGVAVGKTDKSAETLEMLIFVNRLNEGNPRFTPYEENQNERTT